MMRGKFGAFNPSSGFGIVLLHCFFHLAYLSPPSSSMSKGGMLPSPINPDRTSLQNQQSRSSWALNGEMKAKESLSTFSLQKPTSVPAAPGETMLAIPSWCRWDQRRSQQPSHFIYCPAVSQIYKATVGSLVKPCRSCKPPLRWPHRLWRRCPRPIVLCRARCS